MGNHESELNIFTDPEELIEAIDVNPDAEIWAYDPNKVAADQDYIELDHGIFATEETVSQTENTSTEESEQHSDMETLTELPFDPSSAPHQLVEQIHSEDQSNIATVVESEPGYVPHSYLRFIRGHGPNPNISTGERSRLSSPFKKAATIFERSFPRRFIAQRK